ncbi:MAG TPA: helix-turn-helix transcriptional regulator [Candidatus Onthocola stercorigallinarum]|nr:helix-turn-helix transcriptional regulator [Candidatus Onthocola stercorigallinarum]
MKEVIYKILKFIDSNINQKIDIDHLSKHFYINRYYLMKLFKREMGLTINNYINSLRIYNSLKDIKDKSILNVALKNGFYSQEYYSETFKKIMGVKPITYKKYINYDRSVSYKEIDIILNSLINLKDIVNKKENYLHNFLSQDHEQVLSIFR